MNTYFYLQSAMVLKFNQYTCIFENGETGILDLSDFDPKTGVFTYLETEENQKKFSIQNGVITWNNGFFDIAPEIMYYVVTKKISSRLGREVRGIDDLRLSLFYFSSNHPSRRFNQDISPTSNSKNSYDCINIHFFL